MRFEAHQSLKHLIEALGVPHVEVGRLAANGEAVSLAKRIHDGDRIEVRPVAPGCPFEPRFLLDNHLGRLAAYLRMSGFDCLYNNHYEDAELARILAEDTRILLSRDRRLLMRKVVQYGYCLRSLEPQEQLFEVVRRFDLKGRLAPFRRCLRCNRPLEAVSKEAVLPKAYSAPPGTINQASLRGISLCRDCDRVYWKGSHVERMQKLIDNVTS